MSIVFVNDGNGSVIDAGWETNNGANVIRHQLHAKNNQRWQLRSRNSDGNFSTHAFRIESLHSGKVLDLYGDCFVNIHDYWGGDNQLWQFDRNPFRSKFRIVNVKTGLAITAGRHDGDRLTAEDHRHDDATQDWRAWCYNDEPEWRPYIKDIRELIENIKGGGIPTWKESDYCQKELYPWT